MRKTYATYRVRAQQFLALIFAVIVLVTAVLSYAGVKITGGLSENRKLAAMPSVSLAALTNRKFYSSLNSWGSDHQAFRMPLISIASAIQLFGFNTPINDKVLIGRDGYYFYGHDYMIEDYTRKWRIDQSPDYLRSVLTYFRNMQAWARAKNRKLVFMIAPNKHNVYPHKYSQSYAFGNGPGTGEALERWLVQNMPDNIVPLSSQLKAAAQHGQFFFRTDTHWNPLGAKMAVDFLVEHVATLGADARRQQTWLTRSNDFNRGDFAKLLNYPVSEFVDRLLPVGGWTAKKNTKKANAFIKRYLPGRPRKFLWYENTQTSGKTALVIGDSFLSFMAPFIGEHFETSVILNPWGYKNEPNLRFPETLVDAINPDLIVIEVVERRIVPCKNHTLRGGRKLSRAKRSCVGTLTGETSPEMANFRLAHLFGEGRSVDDDLAPTVRQGHIGLSMSSKLPTGMIAVARVRGRGNAAGKLLPASADLPATLLAEKTTAIFGTDNAPEYFVLPMQSAQDNVRLNVSGEVDAADLRFDIRYVKSDVSLESFGLDDSAQNKNAGQDTTPHRANGSR